MTLQIFMALQHCHKRGVSHGDVRPANLLLRADGVVCLTDFRIAGAAPPRRARDPRARARGRDA